MYNQNFYDRGKIIHQLEELHQELSEETHKPTSEQDKEKMRKIIWRTVYQGMLLNSGIMRF